MWRFLTARAGGALAATVAAAATAAALALPASAEPGHITLAGTYAIPSSIFVTDVWGYYDAATGREYAIIGDNGRSEIHIVDVTDPPALVPVSVIPGVAAFDVKVYQHYIYSCDGDQGGIDTRIIDIADPEHPFVIPYALNSTHNLAVSPSGLLFHENPGLRIFDLANPEHPVFIWSSSGTNGHDCTPVGTRLYDFHGYLGTRIWNIGIPAGPKLVGTIMSDDISFHHSGDASADGDYLFICNELANHPDPDFTVWDIRNPAAPVEVGLWADPGSSIHNLYVVDTFAYVSHYAAGFRVFDVSDPAHPVLLDEYDTSVTAGEGFSGAFGVYPYAPSGRVYVSDWDNGLFVFDVEQPTITPVAFTAFDARARGRVVSVSWDVYADEAFAGFRVYRARDDGASRIVAYAGETDRNWTDAGVAPGARYSYAVSAVRADGSEVRSRTVVVSVAAGSSVLYQNRPNPMGPATTIAYDLSGAATARIDVFDARGRLVRTLVDGPRPAGRSTVTWDGTDRDGRPVSSGIYFYRLSAPGETQTRRIVLLK